MAECDVLCLKGHQNCALQTRWTPVPCRKNAMGPYWRNIFNCFGCSLSLHISCYLLYKVYYYIFIICCYTCCGAVFYNSNNQKKQTKKTGAVCVLYWRWCVRCVHTPSIAFRAPSSPRCNHAGWLGIKHQVAYLLPAPSTKLCQNIGHAVWRGTL